MYPAEFDYQAPATVAEAVSLLQQNEDAKVLAGGHSLLPMLKLRLSQPSLLVDIGRIAELKGITEENGSLRLGAMTTQQVIQDSDLVKKVSPLLAETASHVGDPQVRNRGTIGGTLAHGDPAADQTAAFLALGGTVTVLGPNGERTIAADDLFLDMMTTALEPDEVLVSVSVPGQPARTGSAYEKFANAASGYAIVGVAAVVTLDEHGACSGARVAITGAGSKATRALGVESALAGRRLDDVTVAAAAEHAAEGLSLMSDLHASEEYRAHLATVFTRRAVTRAAARAAAGS
ncbi:MAG TPA: xanthine dehydrogenase family protein subunit M [Chloroflexota bacterium]|nr:xanthine dehydrogenase family protein subunit M [Chloroflexota bacterium]